MWEIILSAGLGSLGGAGIVLAGLSGWLGEVWINRLLENDKLRYGTKLEEVRNALDARIRKLQAGIDRTVLVHRLQFETEFKALRDVWAKTATVRSTMAHVRPMLDEVPAGETLDQNARREAARLTRFVEANNELVKSVTSQSPFIPREIHEQLVEIIVLARSEESEVATEGKETTPDWFKRGKAHFDALCVAADKLSDLIRERIEVLAIIGEESSVAE